MKKFLFLVIFLGILTLLASRPAEAKATWSVRGPRGGVIVGTQRPYNPPKPKAAGFYQGGIWFVGQGGGVGYWHPTDSSKPMKDSPGVAVWRPGCCR